jgi:hypothetical protein
MRFLGVRLFGGEGQMKRAIDTGRTVYNPDTQSLDRVIVTQDGQHKAVSPIKHEQANQVDSRKAN